MMRFRVLDGQHIEEDAKGVLIKYPRGSIVTSKTDLCERFNSKDVNFPRKFERVYEETVAEAARRGFNPTTSNTGQTSPPLHDGLDELELKELRSFAAEEEVDLSGATTKQEVIARIRAAVPATPHG